MKPVNHFIFLKPLFIALFCFGTSNSFGQFYPVPEMTIETVPGRYEMLGVTVGPFSISELITVSEFKVYLFEVKRDSSAVFYRAQLPKSHTFSADLLSEIFNSEDLQDKPMPGVSWTVARNYCNWLSEKSKLDGSNFQYDLPFVSDIRAYSKLYQPETNQGLESWTLNAFDESQPGVRTLYPNYHYEAEAGDPPAMKRKGIYGGSFHWNFTSYSAHNPYGYEYQDSSSRYVGFRILRRHTEPIQSIDSVNNTSVIFGFKDNTFNGIYQEKYPSGKNKVLGEFFKGQRIGIWSIWDTNGVLIIQRNYQNNRTFEFLFPVNDHPYKKLYTQYPTSVLKRNADGIYPYLYIEERSVVYSTRGWKQWTNENEPELFEQVDFKTVVKQLFESDITWYLYEKNGHFQMVLSNDSLPKFKHEYESWDFSRIEIQEEFYLNTDYLMSDTRPLGLAFYKNKEDEDYSYLVYLPSVRSDLVKIKVEIKGLKEIENLDDVFYFNACKGEHIKYLDQRKIQVINDKSLDLFLECEKLTIEHELWKAYGR